MSLLIIKNEITKIHENITKIEDWKVKREEKDTKSGENIKVTSIECANIQRVISEFRSKIEDFDDLESGL